MKVMAWLVLALSLGAAASARAAQDPAALEREARQIETMLIAPCCWREQVSVHQSEAAAQVKREIRQMLGTGMARQQVLDAFVQQYGVAILAEPPNRGFGRILYHAPWMVGVASMGGLLLFIRHVTRRPTGPASAGAAVGPGGAVPSGASTEDAVGGSPAGEPYDEQLDDELRALD